MDLRGGKFSLRQSKMSERHSQTAARTVAGVKHTQCLRSVYVSPAAQPAGGGTRVQQLLPPRRTDWAASDPSPRLQKVRFGCETLPGALRVEPPCGTFLFGPH